VCRKNSKKAAATTELTVIGVGTSEFLADRPWEEVELDPLFRDLPTRPSDGEHFPLLCPLIPLLLGPPEFHFRRFGEKGLRVHSFSAFHHRPIWISGI